MKLTVLLSMSALSLAGCSTISTNQSNARSTSSTAPGSQVVTTTDGKTYKLVCDPSGVAEFLRGLIGKAQCEFIDKETWSYMVSHDQPCDNSFKGQFLRGFLGRACETTKNLVVRPEEYSRFRTCDNSTNAQILEGLTGHPRCLDSYQPGE